MWEFDTFATSVSVITSGLSRLASVTTRKSGEDARNWHKGRHTGKRIWGALGGGVEGGGLRLGRQRGTA